MKQLSFFVLGLAACGCAQAEAPLWPDPNEGRTFMGVVTPEAGGRVVTDGGTLEVRVPPGAVERETTVSVTVQPGADGSLTSVYELGPAGASFARPVSISMGFDARVPESQRAVLAWADGEAWRVIPGSRVAEDRIVGATRHFSRFAGRGVPAGEPVYPWREGEGDESAMSYWTWTDPATGLTWQMPSAVRVMTWPEALDYCATLYLDGEGWRLPDIDELRTLVRDCPATETGGSCGVTESCLEMYECFIDDPTGTTSSCQSCADGGCNWDPALFYEGESHCQPPYWSSSTYHAVIPGMGPTDMDGLWAWTLSYAGAMVSFYDKAGTMGEGPIRVRCVR